MIKEKLFYSIWKNSLCKKAKFYFGQKKFEDINRDDNGREYRRLNRIKASRWSIRYQCLACRHEINKDGKLVIDMVTPGYKPIGDYMCRKCSFIMRGGKH